MRFLLGKPLSYAKSGLKPNSSESIKITVKDGLGKTFRSEKTFQISPSGQLLIDQIQFRDFIGTAGTRSNDCFLIPEFDSFSVDLEGQNVKDEITVGYPQHTFYYRYFLPATIDTRVLVWSGVGETIEKEEWRGEIVGNLFYPKNEKPRGLVLHMNGSAMMLQDARKMPLDILRAMNYETNMRHNFRSICLANDGFMVLELG